MKNIENEIILDLLEQDFNLEQIKDYLEGGEALAKSDLTQDEVEDAYYDAVLALKTEKQPTEKEIVEFFKKYASDAHFVDDSRKELLSERECVKAVHDAYYEGREGYELSSLESRTGTPHCLDFER